MFTCLKSWLISFKNKIIKTLLKKKQNLNSLNYHGQQKNVLSKHCNIKKLSKKLFIESQYPHNKF